MKFKFIRVIVFFILSILSFSAQANSYTKRVGESFILPVPKAPVSNSYLNSWSYACSNSKVNIKNSDGTGEVTIMSYFEGSVTIECFISYTIVYGNGNMHAATTYEYHTLRCEENKLSISAPRSTIAVGETMQMSYSFAHPTYGVTPNIKWESGSSCARVDQFGYVTGLSAGTAVIYATSNFGSNRAEYKVKVEKVDPTAIYIPSTLSLTAGESKTINPSLTPSNATTTYTWKSDNPSVASVSNGNITGIRHGSTVITVRTSNGLSSYCDVTVNKANLTLTSSVQSGLYEGVKIIDLKCNHSEADIYYTLDGSNPNVKSNKYSEPFELKNSATIKAIAVHNDYISSNVLILNVDLTNLTVVNFSPQHDNGKVSDFNKPYVEFNFPLKERFDASKISLKIDDIPSTFKASVSGSTLCISPNPDEYNGSHECSITIPSYTIQSVDGEYNTAISYSWSTAPYDAIDIRRPVDIYAAENASLYITSDNVLHYWGILTSGVVDSHSMYEFPNVIKAVCVGNFLAYIDKDHNLWVAGNLRFVKDFGKKPYLYATGVKDIACNGTFFYVTDDGKLYGVGNDTSGSLMGKSTKSNLYGEKYSDTPILLGYNVKNVFAGYSGGLMIVDNGDILGGWGGKFGTTPRAIDTGVKMASARGVDGLPIYLKNDGTAWYVTSSSEPSKVKKFADNVKTLDGSTNRGYFINKEGDLYGFGSNKNRALGDYLSHNNMTLEEYDDVNRYIDIENAELIVSENIYNGERRSSHVFSTISITNKHALALNVDGDVYGWGRVSMRKDFDTSERYKTVSYGANYLFMYPEVWLWSQKNPEIEDVKMPEDMILFSENEYTIPITTIPIDATFSKIEWSTSNPEVVEISEDGTLLAKSAGECNIILKLVSESVNVEKELKIKVLSESVNEIKQIHSDFDGDCEVYNLQGIRVFSGKYSNLQLGKGVFIIVTDDAVYKQLMR